MPILAYKVPGDNYYPQYNRVTEAPVPDTALVKGRLLTKGSGANGNRLQAPGAAGFIRGIYQVTRDVPAGHEDERVQVFAAGTRVGLVCEDANLHAGDLVRYNTTTFKVELWTGTASLTANEYAGKVGRIFEIFSKTDIQTKKDVTAANDIVTVELGQG